MFLLAAYEKCNIAFIRSIIMDLCNFNLHLVHSLCEVGLHA